MRETAPSLEPALAAADAVKAYIRLNRAQLASDGELLALLLPERFATSEVRDLQRFAIERLAAENQALKLERDALKSTQDKSARLSDGVRRFVLDLIDARNLEDVIAVATSAAPAFDADLAVFCVERDDTIAPVGTKSLRLIAPGTVTAVVGPEGMGAILSGCGELLLGRPGAQCKSLAAFRLRLGPDAPPALYVLGGLAEGKFEGRKVEADLGYFTRALERAIRAWLDLPKV
ncbi:MAG: DUF484 family protein [Rhizomicrobium sp.]|jgi:hypothetical protein